ncbi:MAG: hypothetical protein JSU96_12335 [Acidobacteriota bacterium]|nr:MAG: hypothetical protein JSU96_12335 [Acidobacteriota bacterium]
MKNLLLLSVLLATAVPGDRPVTPLTVQGESFVQRFNQAEEVPRVVGIFSPTCGHCLQACSDFEEILERYPEAQIESFILWAPYSELDNVGQAKRAAEGYVPDSRVQHFWDVWKFGSRSYSERLRIVPEDTWGVFLFYAPGVKWEEEAPKPTFWMQNRSLRVGTPFSKKGFEAKLKKWLR